jgi:hypothetical protein
MVTPQCIHGAVSDWLIAVTLDTEEEVNPRGAGLASVEVVEDAVGSGDESPNMDGRATSDDGASASLPGRRKSARSSGIQTSNAAATAM